MPHVLYVDHFSRTIHLGPRSAAHPPAQFWADAFGSWLAFWGIGR